MRQNRQNQGTKTTMSLCFNNLQKCWTRGTRRSVEKKSVIKSAKALQLDVAWHCFLAKHDQVDQDDQLEHCKKNAATHWIYYCEYWIVRFKGLYPLCITDVLRWIKPSISMLSPQPFCIPLMSNLPDSWNLDNGHRHRQENKKTHLTVATSSPRSLVKTLHDQKMGEQLSWHDRNGQK